MADPGDIEPGFRITLGTIYTGQQEQGRLISSMSTDISLLKQQLIANNEENKALRAEVASLKSKFNGVLVSIGTGIIIGVPTLIAFLNSLSKP